MTIHRPDWERKMTIEAWTKGLKNKGHKGRYVASLVMLWV
jgi:hypothetical protein